MFKPEFASLNYAAIAVAGLAAFVLGAVWYTALFGKAWRRFSGYTDEQLSAVQAKRPMPVFFAGQIACYVVSAAVLALLVQALGLNTPGSGALVGAIVWVAVAAFAMTGHLAGPRPLAFFAIEAGFALVFLPTVGAIVAAWR